MLLFPQLSTGATAQYPIRKRRSERAIFNISEDGSVIALWDEAASQVKWDLRFVGLTDQEVENLTSFYELCQGALTSFLFLDPTANLFAYSEDLTQPVWQASSFVSVVPNVPDPYTTTRASQLTNRSEAELGLTQTLAIAGSVSCAFSVYVRSDQPVALTLTRTDGSTIDSTSFQTAPSWNRFVLSTTFASSISSSCDFSLTIPAGQTIDVFGFQAEPQPMPGQYVKTLAQTGVYPNSRFDGNQMVVTATGPGESSLAFSLLSPSEQ